MKIQESAENYLETILKLFHRNGHVRSIDIAREMSFSKPSVSYAMKQFRENGYILIDSDGHITLTDKGMEIAANVYERHTLLTDFLIALGVDRPIAAEDACKIEHDISQETFDRLKIYYNLYMLKLK